MGRRPKDRVAHLTLGEVEEFVSRMEKAARTYRESQALLGHIPAQAQLSLRAAAPERVIAPPLPPPPPVQEGSAMLETPERMEYREEQRKRIEAQKAYLASQGAEKARLKEQFQHDGNPENGVTQ